jgi:hypothetical protein
MYESTLVRAWRRDDGRLFTETGCESQYYYAGYSDGVLYKIDDKGKRTKAWMPLEQWLEWVDSVHINGCYAEFSPVGFEVGEVYATRGGEPRRVASIEGGRIIVTHPLLASPAIAYLDGRMSPRMESPLDLMLPALPDNVEVEQPSALEELDEALKKADLLERENASLRLSIEAQYNAICRHEDGLARLHRELDEMTAKRDQWQARFDGQVMTVTRLITERDEAKAQLSDLEQIARNLGFSSRTGEASLRDAYAEISRLESKLAEVHNISDI